MGLDDGVCGLRVRERLVHGRVRTRIDAVLRERRAALQLERDVERAVGVYESSVRERRMHGRVRPRRETVQRARPADLRRDRGVGERHRVPARMHRGQLHSVHARSEAMQQSAAANLRFGRNLAELHAVHQPGVRRGQLHGRLRAQRDPLREQQRRDLQHERSLGKQQPLRLFRVRERLVHGRVRAGLDSMFRQCNTAVLGERDVGLDVAVHRRDPNLRHRHVHELPWRNAQLRRQHRERLRSYGQQLHPRVLVYTE